MSCPALTQPRRASARGFTLVELMVVVLIISILAVIAVPSVAERLRERRAAEAAQRIASLYRNARLRAMGRGAAILVRFTDNRFQVLEAVRGGAGDCATEPVNSCTTADFNDDDGGGFLEVTSFDPSTVEGVTLTAKDATEAASATAHLDVCYTPLGRAFTRVSAADFFDPMTGVATFSVQRGAGLIRKVAVLPNGMARSAL